MAVDLMGGAGGGDPPGHNWFRRDDGGDEYQPDDIDDEEDQEEQQQAEADTVTPEEETVATPSPASGPTPSQAPPRKRPLNVVHQRPLERNTNRDEPPKFGKKAGSARKGSGSDNKKAKDLKRAEKGGIRYGQGAMKVASRYGVGLEASRPHTTGGTGNTGLSRHETRNAAVANRFNRKVETKLRQKGKPSLKVVATEMQRKEKREERKKKK
jgi:hypothetical protein